MPSNKFQTPIESNNTFILKIEDLIREIVIQNSIPYYRIESSIEQPLQVEGNDKYMPVIRIITYFEDTVAKISEVLQTEFEIVHEKSVDKKKNKSDSFSYKHANYIACLKANRRELIEYKRSGDKKFEIQVCSLLHDAWFGIKKELGYDNDTFPEEAKRDMYRVGALLEMADMEFLKIKSQLTAAVSEAPQPAAAPAPEAKAPETAPAAVIPPVEAPAAVVPPVAAPVTAASPAAAPAEKKEPVIARPAYEAPPARQETSFSEPAPSYTDNIGNANVTPGGSIEQLQQAMSFADDTAPFFEDRPGKDEQKASKPILLDENAQMTDTSLKEYVLKSKLLKEIDAAIADRAGAKINSEIDIEGDVERLRFLKVHTLKQLHDRLSDNKDEIVAFAEKWIGKDNGGTFDSGISLFYLEYLLVGKKNDPAFAVEYVVKFISDNDYSARYIIPTYNSIRNMDANYSHLTLKA